MDNASLINDFINKVKTDGALEDNTSAPPVNTETTPPPTGTQPTPTPENKKTGTFDFTPPPADAPQTSDAPPQDAPPAQNTVTDEQAETYSKMYTLTLNFLVSNVCAFMTGNPPSKYEVDKEQKQQVEQGAKEYFKVSNIAVTPGFYMFITTVTVFGMVCFRAFIDYKNNQALLKQEQARQERIRLEAMQKQAQQQREQEAALAREQQEKAKTLNIGFSNQQPPRQNKYELVDPLKVEMLEKAKEIKTEQPTTTTQPPATPKKIQDPLRAYEEENVTKADIENLPEVVKDRRCFEIDSEGFYELGERREYYNEKNKQSKYKPSSFVLTLIHRYTEQSKEQRVINKLVRQRLDLLKKELGIFAPVAPSRKKTKPQFEH